MPENPERSLEQIEQELMLARKSERELREEQGRSNDTLRKAAQESREALSSSPKSPSSRSLSPLDKARKRVDELPFLAWDAQIKSTELSLERLTLLRDEADKERIAASEEAYGIEQEMKRLEEKIAPLWDTAHAANADVKDYRQYVCQTERELAALKAGGPLERRGGADGGLLKPHGNPFGRP